MGAKAKTHGQVGVAAPRRPGAGLAPGYWREKPLAAMTRAEWEGLCDGCGRCCLLKLEDFYTGTVHYTDVACRLLDAAHTRCTDYKHRLKKVPDCLRLTPARMAEAATWLPPTCAYKLLYEGKPLYDWHPLISGDPESVVAAGISVRGRTVPERSVRPSMLEDHCVRWPKRTPRAGIKKKGDRG